MRARPRPAPAPSPRRRGPGPPGRPHRGGEHPVRAPSARGHYRPACTGRTAMGPSSRTARTRPRLITRSRGSPATAYADTWSRGRSIRMSVWTSTGIAEAKGTRRPHRRGGDRDVGLLVEPGGFQVEVALDALHHVVVDHALVPQRREARRARRREAHASRAGRPPSAPRSPRRRRRRAAPGSGRAETQDPRSRSAVFGCTVPSSSSSSSRASAASAALMRALASSARRRRRR